MASPPSVPPLSIFHGTPYDDPCRAVEDQTTSLPSASCHSCLLKVSGPERTAVGPWEWEVENGTENEGRELAPTKAPSHHYYWGGEVPSSPRRLLCPVIGSDAVTMFGPCIEGRIGRRRMGTGDSSRWRGSHACCSSFALLAVSSFVDV